MFLKLKTNNTNKNLIIIMLSYHRTCGMLSVFGFQVIAIFLRLLIIVQTIGRDVLNILWSLKLLFSYTYTLKCFVVGVCQGLILGKILDLYFKDSIFKTPVGIIFLTYYKKYVLLDEDPLCHLEGEESRRLKRALSYVGFGDRFAHLEEPKRVEFISDWHAYQRDLYSQEAVRQLAATYNSGSDEDDEKSDSDASSDLVECDHCGEKNIDPNELDESEKNLADIIDTPKNWQQSAFEFANRLKGGTSGSGLKIDKFGKSLSDSELASIARHGANPDQDCEGECFGDAVIDD